MDLKQLLVAAIWVVGAACSKDAPADAPPAGVEHSMMIDIGTATGAVPYIFRAGLHDFGWYGPGNPVEGLALGAIRVGFWWEAALDARDLDDYEGRLDEHLRSIGASYAAIATEGGELTVVIGFMPRFLSSCATDETIMSGSGLPRWAVCPPSDFGLWADFVAATVQAYSNAGIEPRWEVWNEPDLDIFWDPVASRATAEGRDAALNSFVDLYRATVIGARRADPSAIMGGPVISGFDEWAEAYDLETGFLKRFIDRVSTTPAPEVGLMRLPLDVVVWHEYEVQPQFATARIPVVRDWLEQAGYARDTPLLIDEWNTMVGGWTYEDVAPAERQVKIDRNDSEYDASYVAARLMALGVGGLDRHSFSSLGDLISAPPEFHGDQGIRTTSGVRKPAYFGLQAMSALHGTDVPVHIDGPSPFLSARASVAEDDVVLVIVNHVTEPDLALAQTLRFGATPALVAEAAELPTADLTALLSGEVDPVTLDLSADLTAFFRASYDALMDSRTWSEKAATIEITVSGLPAGRLRQETRFLVDANHSNAFRVYRRELERGATEAAAVTAALAAGVFETSLSRGREPTESTTFQVTLEPYSVLMVRWSDDG